MKKWFSVLLLLFLSQVQARDLNFPLPELTNQAKADWFNSAPLSKKDLAGKVVLVDFWTFGCWNCYRSFPWLNAMEKRLEGEDFVVLGVHTPEFDHEKDPQNVAAKIKEFDLHHPVMMDNDFAYWKAMNNRYWPSYYIVDKKGQVRANFIGETHEGDRRAKQIEAKIRELLNEET